VVGEIEITADNRSVINPTAEELSMGPLLREAHSSVAHKKLPKRRSDAIGAIGGHCCLAVVISPRRSYRSPWTSTSRGQLLQLQHHQH
jgi:hypothetical protein